MKKDAYENLITEFSEKLADKILLEEGDLPSRARTIDGDIAVLVRDVGLRTSKRVLQRTCDKRVAKKKPKDSSPTETA